MKFLIALLFSTSLAMAAPAPKVPVGYLPVILVYSEGHFVSSVQLEAAETMKECLEHAERAIGGSSQDPSAPAGMAYVGACVAIPPAPGGQVT